MSVRETSGDPKNWYFDHVQSPGKICWCGLTGPAKECDVGEALFRLRRTILGETRVAPLRRRR